MRRRTGDPWVPADRYGRLLPTFMANLVVRDIERALPFYRDVLEGVIHYYDVDFAAIKVGTAELMLHADHAYDRHPWYQGLLSGERRGLGAELRLFGVDPDAVETRARRAGVTVVHPATTMGHGWREVHVQDADGYVWAVGVPAPKP
jgi:uncharacterized glyoxalase superfamily protein PhnB